MIEQTTPTQSAGAAVVDAAPKIGELLCDPAMESRRLEVPAGTPLYEPDAPARNLYYILGGQVRLFLVGPDKSARMMEILGTDDWFGVPALSGADRYGSRAVAVTQATVCEVAAHRLLSLLPQFPPVAVELIRQLATKLQSAHSDAANLVFDDTNQRLIKTLLQFSRSAAASPQESGEGIVLRITHQQLAQAIGAARETVSLALTQLRQRNLLRTGRNRLSFDPQALEDFYQRGNPQRSETPQ